MNLLIYGMVYLGSALMVYNVYSYIQYAKHLQEKKDWGKERSILYIPIFLLVMFLLGYLAVGIFGKPDIIISGILFGGSIFVCIIFYLLQFITGRVQENEKLEAKALAAEEASKSKTDFLSRVSHEMRTPMNAIIGLDTIALKNPDLQPETRDQLEKININAYHLLGLIDNVLEMNEIDSGQMALKEENFSLRKMLSSLNKIFRSGCLEKGLDYQTAVIGSLEEFYTGDETRLKQVLFNTLNNAVKFTPSPGTVTFTTEQIMNTEDKCSIRFIVSDTGIGISEEFIEKLFDPFGQEDMAMTNRYGGSGLGMTIVKNIVDKMDGQISVKSQKDSWSTFTITIPLGRVPQDEAAASNENAAIPENEENYSLQGRHVLIAEDIDLNAEILIDLLDMEEVTADRAENGKICVEKFKNSPENHYDAILMDLRMPVMDGLDAARNIRALERPDAQKVPIIAVSANASETDRKNALEAGMNTHLSKPVDAEKLYETLGRLMTGCREAA